PVQRRGTDGRKDREQTSGNARDHRPDREDLQKGQPPASEVRRNVEGQEGAIPSRAMELGSDAGRALEAGPLAGIFQSRKDAVDVGDEGNRRQAASSGTGTEPAGTKSRSHEEGIPQEH